MKIHVTHVLDVEDGAALNAFCAATPKVFTERHGYRVIARITQPATRLDGTNVMDWGRFLEGVDVVGHYPIDEMDPDDLIGTGMAYMIPLIERRQAEQAARLLEQWRKENPDPVPAP